MSDQFNIGDTWIIEYDRSSHSSIYHVIVIIGRKKTGSWVCIRAQTIDFEFKPEAGDVWKEIYTSTRLLELIQSYKAVLTSDPNWENRLECVVVAGSAQRLVNSIVDDFCKREQKKLTKAQREVATTTEVLSMVETLRVER